MLLCIVVIGAGVTFATSRYIGRSGAETAAAGMAAAAYDGQTTGAYPEQEKLAAARGAVTGASPERSAESRNADGAPQERGRKEEAALPAPAAAGAGQPAANDEAAVPEQPAEGVPSMMKSAEVPEQAGAGVSEDSSGSGEASPEVLVASGGSEIQSPVISPLGPNEDVRTIEADARASYEEHLAEIDSQIQKMRAEASDSSTYSMKNLAEKELQMWNLEMNSLYGTILKALGTDEAAELEKSQQAWLKSRDTKAEDTARKYSGGSLEGVEYTASLAESTRQRAYDLVDEYIDVLSKNSGQ